jgi:hypothetical protein
VIVRRHPDDGYLFQFTNDAAETKTARGLHFVAAVEVHRMSPRSANVTNATFSHDVASRIVKLMCESGALVDDGVLKTDKLMRQWTNVVGYAFIGVLLLTGATTDDHPEWWPFLSSALLFMGGLLVGLICRGMYERDLTIAPTPWGTFKLAAGLIGILAVLYIFGLGLAESRGWLGGWGVWLWVGGWSLAYLAAPFVYILWHDRRRARSSKEAAPHA